MFHHNKCVRMLCIVFLLIMISRQVLGYPTGATNQACGYSNNLSKPHSPPLSTSQVEVLIKNANDEVVTSYEVGETYTINARMTDGTRIIGFLAGVFVADYVEYGAGDLSVPPSSKEYLKEFVCKTATKNPNLDIHVTHTTSVNKMLSQEFSWKAPSEKPMGDVVFNMLLMQEKTKAFQVRAKLSAPVGSSPWIPPEAPGGSDDSKPIVIGSTDDKYKIFRDVATKKEEEEKQNQADESESNSFSTEDISLIIAVAVLSIGVTVYIVKGFTKKT